MLDHEVREFVADLMARRWQKDLSHLRGFSSEELSNISFQYLSKPWIPLNKVKERLDEVSSRRQVYLRFEALQALKSKYPDIMP